MKITSVALAFLGMLVASGLAYGGQVLVNGDFATGTVSPWTSDTRYGSGTGWLITTSNCYSGTYCVVDTGNVALEQTFAGVPTNTITAVTFYMNTSLGGTAFDFFYQGGADDEFFALGTPTAVTGWDFFDVTSDLSAGGTLIGFEVFGNTTTDPSYLDNLSITTGAATTPEPSTLMLMLTGLALALAGGAARRKTRVRPA